MSARQMPSEVLLHCKKLGSYNISATADVQEYDISTLFQLCINVGLTILLCLFSAVCLTIGLKVKCGNSKKEE